MDSNWTQVGKPTQYTATKYTRPTGHFFHPKAEVTIERGSDNSVHYSKSEGFFGNSVDGFCSSPAPSDEEILRRLAGR